jgi:beta-fructofuranosidase
MKFRPSALFTICCFLVCLSALSEAKAKVSFQLVLDSKTPAFDISPNQTRMATCYRDKAGTYHLFTDFMEKSSGSWDAVVRYYRSSDLRTWEFVETVVKKGNGTDKDAFGAASPHVLATDDKIYLFYAGRANPVGGQLNPVAQRGQSGYLACRIMLASAEVDEHGAPIGPFQKQGVLIEPGDGWDSMRLDDPSVVLDGDTVHLFFKGFNNNINRNHVQAGYATGKLSDMKFTKHLGPVLSVPGGGEMPRVFRKDNTWHMFYHHFANFGHTWQHYISDDGINWRLLNSSFFMGHPIGEPRDIMMIYGMNGTLLDEPKMLVTGAEDGINKLWLYHLREKETRSGFEQSKTGRVYDTSDNPFMAYGSGITTDYGDPFPVYFDGLWHIYLLQAGNKAILHLTSSDLVNWVEHAPALIGCCISTGSILKHQGTYYMFYTTEDEDIGLVTSDNPWFFDKNTTRKVAMPEGPHAGASPYHDAALLYCEAEELWWLMFEAHVKVNEKRRVDVALYKAKSLEGPWKRCEALYSHPELYVNLENSNKFHRYVSCPEVFRQGDTWYLNYLSHGTLYHTASTPYGPWGEPKGQYNSDFMTAGSRSATDGKRRLNWGFFTYRPTPEGDPIHYYGGALGLGRQMVFNDDNTIGVKPFPELVTAIRKPEANVRLFAYLKPVSGKWKFVSSKQTIGSLHREGGTVLIDLPKNAGDYYFETDIDFENAKADVSVTVRTSAELDRGFRIALSPTRNVFEITEFAGKRRSFHTKTYHFSKTANLKIFICDEYLEAFVDDQVDLSVRVLDSSGFKIALETENGRATFRKPFLHYFKQKAQLAEQLPALN